MTTTTTLPNGRLCNQIIRNLCVSLLAEKSDLHVLYCSYDRIYHRMGIPLFIGRNMYHKTLTVNDDTFLEVLESKDTLRKNVDANAAYFQTREITPILYEHLRSPSVRDSIVIANPFRERYGGHNNDCCVHIRLTDAAHHNPGIEYYSQCLSMILCADGIDNIFVATDQPYHPLIQQILERHENAKLLLSLDEVQTLQFGSTCKYLVLSHGSYSAVMGWLAFDAEKVYYPKYNPQDMWYGDMFSIPSWKEVPWRVPT